MILGFTESEHIKKTKTVNKKRRRLLFCRICTKHISDIKYLISADGGSPNRIFRNPNGFVYEIITLCQCEGTSDTSSPILYKTWFPGYPWIVVNCSTCLTHLGWRWENERRIPPHFFGLIRERLEEYEI